MVLAVISEVHMPTYGEKSSFTAEEIAFRRTFTDIPLSNEIFKLIEGSSSWDEARKAHLLEKTTMPFFEARYLMTDRLIAKTGYRQVLELAAGFSPRGILMTANPDVTVVEVDLDTIAIEKWRIVRELRMEHLVDSPRYNLNLVLGDVLDPTVLDGAAALFRKEPIAVVCEGLLRYLSIEDQIKLAQYIRKFLGRFGGCWITPDYEVKNEEFSVPGRGERYEKKNRDTGVDVLPNLFESGVELIGRLEAVGFAVEKFPLGETAAELVSPKRFGMDDRDFEKVLNIRSALVLSPI